MLIAGGGASLRLTDRLRINAAVRDYVMTPEATLTDVSTTDDLTHNTMISTGLTFSIGRSSGPSSRELELQRQREARNRATRELAERERADRMRTMQADSSARERGEPRSMRDTRRNRVAMADSMRMTARERDDSTMRAMHGDSSKAPGAETPRWITVPVPTVGQVILRYGLTPSGASTTTGCPTTGFSTDELRRLIREELQRDSTRRAATGSAIDSTSVALGATPRSASEEARLARIAAMEEELQRRLDAVQKLEVERRNAAPTPTVEPTPTVVPDTSSDVRIASVPVFQRFGETRSRDLRPLLGVGGGDGTQAVASLRADPGPLTPGVGSASPRSSR